MLSNKANYKLQITFLIYFQYPMNMATDVTKQIESCNICSKAIEHHCKVCQVSLCWSCMTTHMTDKTNRHQVVQFNYREKEAELPECSSHERKHCEMYCNDCDKPICVFCVTTEHKKYEENQATNHY